MRKLTLKRAKITLLAKHIKSGLPLSECLHLSQVPSSTYYRWMQIGRALVEGNFEHPDIPEQPTRREGESRRKYDRRLRRHEEKRELYFTLYKEVQKAGANLRIDMVKSIRSAAIKKNDWRAALAFLERRDPDNWNLKRILRNAATEDKHHNQHSDMCPDFPEFLRLLGKKESAVSKGLEDNAHAGT